MWILLQKYIWPFSLSYSKRAGNREKADNKPSGAVRSHPRGTCEHPISHPPCKGTNFPLSSTHETAPAFQSLLMNFRMRVKPAGRLCTLWMCHRQNLGQPEGIYELWAFWCCFLNCDLIFFLSSVALHWRFFSSVYEQQYVPSHTLRLLHIL